MVYIPQKGDFIFRISKASSFSLSLFHMQVSELQAPPQQTTIDLSLNRTQPAPTTTTTTSIDNNTEKEHADSGTLPAEEGIANEDPKPRSAGSTAKSTRPSSHHSQVVDDSNSSKPEEAQEFEIDAQGGGEKEGEENNVIEPESTVQDEGTVDDRGEGANGEAVNPPEEEIVEEEEDTETREEEERPSHEAEEASDELEATKDTAVEEVSEEVEQEEETDPHAAAPAVKPETVEPQPTEEGSGGEKGAVDSTTEPLDTSVPEEIVVRLIIIASYLSPGHPIF